MNFSQSRLRPGPVGSVGPLGDQPFPAPAAGLPEIRLAVGVPVRGEAERAGERDKLAEQALPLAQRQSPDVMAAGEHQVEEVEVHPHGANQLRLRLGHLHPLLQPGKAGPAALEGDDLAIGYEVDVRLPGQRCGQLGIRGGDLFLVARHEPHSLALTERQAALAVQLPLEQPAGIGEAVIGQRGELGRQPRRDRCRGAVRQLRPAIRFSHLSFAPARLATRAATHVPQISAVIPGGQVPAIMVA